MGSYIFRRILLKNHQRPSNLQGVEIRGLPGSYKGGFLPELFLWLKSCRSFTRVHRFSTVPPSLKNTSAVTHHPYEKCCKFFLGKCFLGDDFSRDIKHGLSFYLGMLLELVSLVWMASIGHTNKSTMHRSWTKWKTQREHLLRRPRRKQETVEPYACSSSWLCSRQTVIK